MYHTLPEYYSVVLDSKSMSKLFEEMFKNYDMNVLPSVSGEPLKISTGMYINDMVPISPVNMVGELYSPDFQQGFYRESLTLAYLASPHPLLIYIPTSLPLAY